MRFLRRNDRSSVRSLARNAAAFVVMCLLLAAPAGTSSINLYRLELVLLYATAAIGLSIVVGYAGELLLVQPAVIAVSAYTAALLDIHLHWEPLAILPFAIVPGVLVGTIVATTGLRVRGLYLGIISFFGVIVLEDISAFTQKWSGGDAGLSGLSAFHVGRFRPDWLVYEVAFVLLVLTYAAARLLVRSGWGLRLHALREAPRSLLAAGVSVSRTKMSAYVVSVIPGALVGWIFPYVNRSVGTQFFGLSFTLLLLAAVELGGRGSLIGAAVAAAALEAYSILVGPFSQYNTIGLGVALLVAVVVLPGGIGALVRRRLPTSSVSVDAADGADELRPSPIESVDSPATVEVHGLAKNFGGNRALDDVNLRLARGRVVGLIGGNGSGKTTIINTVTGLQAPSEGTITLRGVDVTNLAAHRRAALGVARTFQVPELIAHLSVRENVEVGLLHTASAGIFGVLFGRRRAAALDRQRMTRAIAALGEVTGSTAIANAPIEIQPLGVKRMVEIARAVSGGAETVLLDEPGAGLSDAELERLGSVLSELRQRGKAVLLVEHNVPFVMKYCDDIVLLEEGRVVAEFDNTSGGDLPQALGDYLRHVPSLRSVETMEPVA